MVLTDCELIEAECIFLLIDNGVLSNEKCNEFMNTIYYLQPEMYALLNWMLTRWVFLRKHKYHLPKRIRIPLGTSKQYVNLTNLIHSNST